MKLNKTQVVVAMAVLMIMCLGASAYGTPSSPPRPYDYRFEPVDVPRTAGPVTFVLEVTTTDECNRCEDVHITIETVGGVEYNGPRTHTIHPQQGERYSETIMVNLLPNDTGSVFVFLNSQDPNRDTRKCWPIRRSFVTTGDTVEYFLGFPRLPPPDPAKERAEMLAKARTPEKLAMIYGVRFKLRDSTQRQIYESIVGALPEARKRGFYFVETTLGNILQLADSGFKFEYVPPGEDPFPSLAPPLKADSTTDSVPRKKEPSSPQGSLGSPTSEDGISIVNVDGEIGWGVLSMNDTIRFHIRVNNNFSQYFTGVTNGFKLFGLYGNEQWSTPIGEWDTTVNWGSYFDQTFVSYADADGSGADTIGFGAFKIFQPGMPPSFDADGWTITTTVDFPANEGGYICIDSAYYPPSGTWKWAGVGGADRYPDWWGPYCYEMQPNLVYVSGHARYLKATPSDTLPAAMRGAKVVLWDVDYIPDLRYDSLGCENVDENGYFDFGPISNTDYKGSGGQDLFFDIYAENEAAYVTDQNDVRKFMTTLGYVVEDVPSGFFDTTITASQSQSDPFFVADCILDGYKKWTSLRPSPGDDPGGPVQVKLYSFTQNT